MISHWHHYDTALGDTVPEGRRYGKIQAQVNVRLFVSRIKSIR
ncbi:hypothetical protein HMPREF0868_1389 [Mageeibacillus indolicus UPII9-5]|uniref:Uncharacterized protein n=1 Tax=Mageeibacillus indolicus (strain UPII9-5) TaxID=699246 RepID=D3QYW3_MAGIU|nr:hypothetical protein HMPREF0868_1389 [Mageeibacillus indolicus UPII9-5]